MTTEVKVAQIDRDAAAYVLAWFQHPNVGRNIHAGEWDKHPIVQAFARHRLAERAAIVAWLLHHYPIIRIIADAIEQGQHYDD